MAMGFVPCFAALLAAVVVRQAQGTPEDVVSWTLHSNTQCGTATLVGEGSDEALQFETEAEAKAACAELGMAVCFGIYDMACSGDTFFLCDAAIVTEADDLGFSSTSCSQELLVITGTATTTTNTAVGTTTAIPDVANNATTIPFTPPPVDVNTTTVPSVSLPAGVDACDVTCSLLDGIEDLTCREQILGFAPPTTDTGSMPMLELTCEQKQAMVSGQGTCQACASCDVCLTTLAETGLWKLSDRANFDAALALKGTRSGLGPLVAGIAMIGGIAAGSVVALRRVGLDLSRWELLRQQPSVE